MARIIHKRPAMFDDEEVDADELGAETESEKHMKDILKKQLKTDLSLKEQFSQHRSFVCPSTQAPLAVAGSCSLERLKELELLQESREELQRCGLAPEEIEMYISYKSGKQNEKTLVNPSVQNENITRIESKIRSHNEELQKPQTFSNVKKLTRHEMDIEKTLYSGCANKLKLSSLVAPDTNDCPIRVDDAFNHVKSLSDKIMERCRKKRKEKKISQKHSGNDSEIQDVVEYDLNIHHVTVPLEENEVLDNRLSLEEIKNIPRFKNYRIGEPSQVLYLKNLNSKATIAELRSLFGRFQDENFYSIEYKICTGRMKGQAFVTFSDAKIAEKALHFVNGYLLRGKPLIIEFGRHL